MRSKQCRRLAALAVFGGLLTLGAEDALAVVGRPLTPMSYAGVARRTTRRAVYAGAAVSTSAAYTRTWGRSARIAAAIPQLKPPPP